MTFPQRPDPYQQPWQPPQQRGYQQPGHQYPGYPQVGQHSYPQPGQQYPGYAQQPRYPSSPGVPPQYVPPPPRKRRKWPFIVGGIVAFIVVISAIAGGGGAETATVAGETVAVAPAAPAGAPQAQQAQQVQEAPPVVPEPPPTPIVYEGKGDDVVTIEKPVGVAVLDFECPRCSQNVIVKTDGAETLLVNTIGAYKGRHLIDASSTSRTTTLTVTAKGPWKVTVTPGLSVLRRSDGGPISGKGDDVVLVASSTSKAAVTYRGDQNFIVRSIGEYTGDLLINEIGSYEGTVPLRGPAVAIVTSSGDWTITPS